MMQIKRVLKYSKEINSVLKSNWKKIINYVIASECIKKLPFNTGLRSESRNPGKYLS